MANRRRAGGRSADVLDIGRMCGRYVTPDEAAIEREWSRLPRDYIQSFNLAPSQQAPVVVETDADPVDVTTPQRRVVMMTWGFQPSWANRSWINARAESVFQNRAFRASAVRQRCLVLAAGWYEWTGEKAPRQPFLFRRIDGRLIAFAGIWTERTVNDRPVSTFAVLTTAANELAATVHDRMPLILDPLAYDGWLSPASKTEDVAAVLHAPGNEGLEAFPVSKAVNSPRNDAPELVRRIVV